MRNLVLLWRSQLLTLQRKKLDTWTTEIKYSGLTGRTDCRLKLRLGKLVTRGYRLTAQIETAVKIRLILNTSGSLRLEGAENVVCACYQERLSTREQQRCLCMLSGKAFNKRAAAVSLWRMPIREMLRCAYIACNAEEDKRFCEMIFTLLIVDAIQGAHLMVQATRRLVLDELEATLDEVDSPESISENE
ncbi:hypothetical protein GH714_037656 [Hevea brasiliensis]|uniref:Uncharacterized protein n=1 Tax=Hevea brasiliensis TaxID=3981 RepID=A0A6A6MS83_HEVBR|nr:hypothetical protein GH714_037656 [Hevea brasiliensis]